ncbi:MAG: LacI family DNA-binding transcriptional regulator [Cyclobacteriaceae bacterium]
MGRGRVKITDIARELGVSASTVSRALSNGGRISDETKKKVIELANKWGYKPNPFAISLLKKQSKTIGLILPEFTHHYFTKVLSGVNQVVNEEGYHLFIVTHEGSLEKEQNATAMLSSMHVDGIIASYARGTTDFEHYLDLLEDDVPVVFLDRSCEDLDTSYVITDDFPGCIESIDHLVKSGNTRIIHISGPDNLSTSFTRMTGYKEGLRKNGLTVNEKYILNSEDREWKNRFKTLVLSDEVEAVHCFNDYVAYEVIQELKKLNKIIPEDISVIGFADEPVATYMSPQLSTVMQPAEEMGRRAAEILIGHIRNPDSDQLYCEQLPTNLILRESTRQIRKKENLKSVVKVLKSTG